MKSPSTRLLLAALAIIAVTMFVVLNVFGRELNALMLRAPGLDKGLHFTGFAVLFMLLYTTGGRIGLGPRYCTVAAVAACVAMSLADEALQSLSPGRNVEAADLVADWSGVAIGWVLIARPRPRFAVPVASAAIVAAGSVTYASYQRLHDYSDAIGYLRNGDFVMARASFLKALEAGNHSASIYNGLSWADVESGRGDPRKAVEWAELALRVRPDDANVLDTYGWALHNAGRSREAIPPLERAYAQMPDMFCIHYHLGSAYLAVGRRADAERHFRAQLLKPATREAPRARHALAAMGVTP